MSHDYEQIEVLEKWEYELRSGNYPQGCGVLRQRPDALSDEKFCCLGVLCDLYLEAHPERSRWEGGISSTEPKRFKVGGHDTSTPEMPPAPVLEWAGISRGLASDLAELNDGGATFDEVARVIEGIRLTKQWK